MGASKLQRRRHLLLENEAPTQSEVRKYLGSPLAEIFFGNLNEREEKLMGITPYLMGPGKELWVSPSDLLVGKVLLTKPMTRKYIRALTHKGILELGEEYLGHYENQMRMEKEQAVVDAERDARMAAMLERREAVKLAIEEERQKYDREKESMIEQFHKTIEDAVNVTKQRFVERMKVTVQNERSEVANLIEDHMELALQTQEVNLIKHYQMEETLNLSALNTDYQQFLLENKQKMDNKLQKITDNYNCQLEQIHHRMECENLSDVSYAILHERERYKAEKEELQKEFDQEIAKLNTVIEEKTSQISILKGETEKVTKDLKAWEDKTKLIVHEFQKFINYSLGAVSGQAEFLLTLEKLLVLEVGQALSIPESEPECPPTEISSGTTVLDSETAKGIIDSILLGVYEKTDLNSSTALHPTRKAILKVLEAVFMSTQMDPDKKTLYKVIGRIYDAPDLHPEKETLAIALSELPTEMYLEEILDHIQQSTDVYVPVGILLTVLQKVYESSETYPPQEVINNILEGVYYSLDMILGKEILIKVLERVYRSNKYPLKDIMGTVLENIYETVDVCLGREILLKVLQMTSDKLPSKDNLVKLIELVYSSLDKHPAKAALLNELTIIYESTHPGKETVTKILKGVDESNLNHPGRDIILTAFDWVYETQSPRKEIMIDVMDRMLESSQLNPSKEVLFNILDSVYTDTSNVKGMLGKIMERVFERKQDMHLGNQIFLGILDSVYEQAETHPGEAAVLSILDTVYDKIIQKPAEAVSSEILLGILDSVYKQAETHPGEGAVLSVLDRVYDKTIQKPAEAVSSEMFREEQGIMTYVEAILTQVYKSTGVQSPQNITSLIPSTHSSEKKQPRQCHEEHHICSSQCVHLPAADALDKIIEIIFEATDNVQESIKGLETGHQEEADVNEPDEVAIIEMQYTDLAIQEAERGLVSEAETEHLLTTEVGNVTEEKIRQSQKKEEEDVTKLPFKDRGLIGEGGNEHLDTKDDFLAKRLDSLLRIFRQHTSLANLFVPHGGTGQTTVS